MTTTPYDSVAYPGKFYPQASIERLHGLARLRGLKPAPVARCQVLELGCGDGGHLIPQAAHFPDSHFLGVDLSAQAVARGQALIAELGLRNIELRAADLMTLQVERGAWDYVSGHGVLSWLPAPVRERFMDLLGEALAPAGIGYVSYAALPGGYLRNVPRDLMRFHTRSITDPAARAQAGRAAVQFVASALPADAFGQELLRREMAGSEGKDFFLLHDLLADDNEPLYFVDFIAAAAERGLAFLAESESGGEGLLPAATRTQLAALPDRLEREQYIDFMLLRRFRQTLLCRSSQAQQDPPCLDGLWLSSRARPQPGGDGRAFLHPSWGRVLAPTPWAAAALRCLSAAWPADVRYEDLLADCERQLGEPAEAETRRALDGFLVEASTQHHLELHSQPYPFDTRVPARPRCSALARWQAAAGLPVVSGELAAVALPGALLPRLLPLLDGSRDVEDLLVALAERLPEPLAASMDAAKLHEALGLLARNALLLSD